MTTRIEYGNKDAADAARDRHSEYLCTDDDRRLKTVAYSDADTPDQVLEAERLEAEDSRRETTGSTGQSPLSDSERDRIDFSKGRANTLHARSVKGIAMSEGVEDWVSYYDPTLTVDEHREVMDQASRESGSRTAEESVKSWRYRLKIFVDWAEDEGIEAMSDVTGWTLDEYETHRRGQDLTASTLNGEMQTLKNWLEYLARVGVVDEGLPEKVHVPGIPAARAPTTRCLTRTTLRP